MEEAHSQASDQFEEEEVKGDEATHAYFDPSDFNAVKTAIEQEKRRLRAIVLIQARVRGILHRKQAEVEKGKKTKIT